MKIKILKKLGIKAYSVSDNLHNKIFDENEWVPIESAADDLLTIGVVHFYSKDGYVFELKDEEYELIK